MQSLRMEKQSQAIESGRCPFRLFALLLLALVAFPSANALGNCSSAEPMVVTTGGFRIEVLGARVTLWPLEPSTGNIFAPTNISIEMDVITERARVSVNTDGVTLPQFGPACAAPQSPLNSVGDWSCLANGLCVADPLTAPSPGVQCPGWGAPQECGALLKVFRFSDFDCWAEQVTIDVQGHQNEAINVHFSDPTSDFAALGSYRIPSEDFVFYPPVTLGEHIGWRYSYVGQISHRVTGRTFLPFVAFLPLFMCLSHRFLPIKGPI